MWQVRAIRQRPANVARLHLQVPRRPKSIVRVSAGSVQRPPRQAQEPPLSDGDVAIERVEQAQALCLVPGPRHAAICKVHQLQPARRQLA